MADSHLFVALDNILIYMVINSMIPPINRLDYIGEVVILDLFMASIYLKVISSWMVHLSTALARFINLTTTILKAVYCPLSMKVKYILYHLTKL